jgi:Domain of unknown function (DUF1977)
MTQLTAVKEIPYFVSDQFMRTYYRDRYQLAQVERMVEKAYEKYLLDECNSQQDYKRRLDRAARTEKDPEVAARKLKAAAEYRTGRCIELDDLFPRNPARLEEKKRKSRKKRSS